ncbi:histidine phosphatase family protein [Variovorax sp. 770b2]|uniref:histidine phosphatase family protein n=1 Tax=Variovorax sp. 770b2 TaxID=1566271 RepID=UPI0008E1B3F7|nr:histidine phosphatase family protein [Variovorax sp. 770b2]SFP49916.1 probable phosphoglycerate mutase [Variovorax sp. 770b2]
MSIERMSQATPSPSPHTAVGGLDALVRIAATQSLAPDCDHFYFLRHGQTGRNALRIFQAVDEPLSELGLQQAAHAAELLAGEPIRTIVCSDARRAFDTAHTVAAALRLTPTAQAELRERNFGALIGTSSANIDWACEPEGGETLTQFVARKRAALDAALKQPAPVLVVAHGGTLYALAALLGVPIDVTVLGNAQPLRFSRARNGLAWAVTPLLRHAGGEAALA